MLEELNLFCFTDWSNNSVAVDLIKDGSVLERKSSLKILGLSFFSKLDWNLIRSLTFLSSEVPLYLYESTLQS